MKSLVFLICIFLFSNIHSQTISNINAEFEQSIRMKFDSAKILSSDSAKLEMMRKIESEFAAFLKNQDTYTYPFDSLKTMGKVKSPDNEFRLFSWNIFIHNESFRNYSIIQMKPEKDKECHVIILQDNSEIDKVGNMALNDKNWYGALYYKIITHKIDGTSYYTLLGLDPYSPFISKKIIDVLYFNNGEAFLGTPIFNVSGKMVSRMVFSYSARVSMMLNYDETLKTIVFDHLSPSETRYTGQYEFYGPDFSFDGFLFSKKYWLFVEDVKPNRPDRKK